jgi:hypothetical protein
MSKIIEGRSAPVPDPGPRGDDIQPADAATEACVEISPAAFLRSMALIFWSAFRHPFKTTEIDLATGRVIRHY